MENTNIETFGVHFMLDGYGANKEILADKAKLEKMLSEIPVAMGMYTISKPFVLEVGPLNRKDPGGLSGFVLIAESHISFHTFPKRGFVTIDVYTCQNVLDTKKLTELFIETFDIQDHDMYIINRGTKYPVENIYN
ncbi:MAG TPA: adenosylmethionine decarboxylase [Candidatus Paceibacterota bacterium]|nr:adenosylmethionine decarboxylase [Candidatus Paceibacterota bacterium]